MAETYIAMDEVLDRIRSHPDVKTTRNAHIMLRQLGNKQDLTKKPRQHITKSRAKSHKKHSDLCI
jgi:hypothetical protein